MWYYGYILGCRDSNGGTSSGPYSRAQSCGAEDQDGGMSLGCEGKAYKHLGVDRT